MRNTRFAARSLTAYDFVRDDDKKQVDSGVRPLHEHLIPDASGLPNMRRLFQYLIRLYQNTLSLDHGPLRRFTTQPRCKFHPTCSQYAYEAIGRFGVFKGTYLAIKRIFRCHPWTLGGIDPVPEELQKIKK